VGHQRFGPTFPSPSLLLGIIHLILLKILEHNVIYLFIGRVAIYSNFIDLIFVGWSRMHLFVQVDNLVYINNHAMSECLAIC
jgi:hypothetical protein